MSHAGLFDKITIVKDKFKKFFGHRKKVKALENYAEVVPMRHFSYLSLIKKCLMDGFLDDKEADFLDHLLTKYEINYLQWSYKTKSMKQYMRKLAKEHQQPDRQMMLFDIDKKREQKTYEVPVHLLKGKIPSNIGRRL